MSKSNSVDALGLTPEQLALANGLQFVAQADLKHTSKTADDVVDAFTENVLKVIAGSAMLGGEERVSEVKPLLDQYQKLQALNRVLEPLARKVSQNLLVVGAKLATHAGEVVKTADANKKTKPQLLEGVSDARDWLKKHHPGRAPRGPGPKGGPGSGTPGSSS